MKFQEQGYGISNTGEMITERKALGVIDSNVTRIQPKRAAKTGHKWLANRPQKSEDYGNATKTELPQRHTYLQHLALQRHKAASKENEENSHCFPNEFPNIMNASFKNLKQCDNYGHVAYQNKNCPFRVPLQTLSFGNVNNSITTVDQDHKALLFPSILEGTRSDSREVCVCTDADVSLRSIPEDDLSETFLNKSQSPRNFRKVIASEGDDRNQFSRAVEIVEEYLPDILSYMRESEIKYKPKENYLEKQAEITPLMRVKLIDWLIEVQDEYKLHNETLYLAVAFVDRFLSEMSVTRGKLQLLGTASMFLAAKIEEIYPPDANEFAYVTADTYTRNEVLLMERMILNVLECALAVPTSLQYLSIFLEKSNLEEKVHYLSNYLSEITLINEKYLQYLPSVKAAAAITLAIFVIRYSHYCDVANGNLESQENTENMNVESGFIFDFPVCICSTIRSAMSDSVEQIYRCVLDMAGSHLHVSNSTHFVREKYLTTSQKNVAKLTPLFADATLNKSRFLSWDNIAGMWQT